MATYPSLRSQEISDRTGVLSWLALLPAHRRPVLAKTPLLIAVGVFLAGGRLETRPVLLTMALATALWALLYALNESTDLQQESGILVERRIQILLFLLPIGICLAAACLSPHLGLLFSLMTVGQIAYSAPPLRVKRWWWAVLLLSGVLNPILRLECGAVWGPHAIPLLAYAVLVSLHLGAAIRARTLLKERDRQLAYVTAPDGTEWAGIACMVGGLLGGGLLCLQGFLPRVFLVFLVPASVFSLYAWSGRIRNMAQLRQGWLVFAILALLALAVLLSR